MKKKNLCPLDRNKTTVINLEKLRFLLYRFAKVDVNDLRNDVCKIPPSKQLK